MAIAKKFKTRAKAKPRTAAKARSTGPRPELRELQTAPLLPAQSRLRLPKRLLIVAGSAVVLISLAVGGSVFALHAAADRYKVRPEAYAKPMYHIAEVLSSRPGSTLVGRQDMLTVLHPTLGSKRQTFALNSCPAANDAVTKQLQKHSIAVLVHIGSNPAKQQCTLAQIVAAYGRPNASTTLTGSLTAPKEVLLFYDNGPQLSGPVHPVSPPEAPATVISTTLATIPAPVCSGKTYLSFVAHEDDDLLFMNPDHLHELRGGDCLRTVYLTAGDDGLSKSYWLGREKGAEAAYDSMAGHGASLWLERYITVNNHEYIKMASPRGNANITLVFVNLADGNVPGGGFLRTHYESLAKLADGSIATMHTVDGQSTYTKSDLTNMLLQLMQFYHPSEIDTQTPLSASVAVGEHSDHMTTGQFATSAYALYGQSAPLKYYTGYPVSLLPQNVSGQDLADKTAAFYAYVPHDGQVCLNPADCAPTGPYASWLMREYTYTPGDPMITPPVVPPPAPAPVAPDPSGSGTTDSGSGTVPAGN